MFKKKVLTAIIVAAFITMMFASAMPSTIAENGTTKISVEPTSIIDPTMAPGATFTVKIMVTDVSLLYTWQIKLFFNPAVLECTSATYPSDHVFAGQPIVPVPPVIDNVAGFVLHGCSLLGAATPFTGSGPLCELGFKVKARGESNLKFSGVEDTYLLADNMDTIPAELVDGYFNNKIVELQPPVAQFDYSPKPPKVGDVIVFDASASYDPDGTIISYDWDFGDGATASGKIVSHSYSFEGSYKVVLTVIDNSELLDTEEITIIVQPAPPPPPPPPITVGIQVQWANWSNMPQYPFGGQYHNGAYPVWKNFTIINGGTEDIIYIAITYPQATPAFKLSRGEIRTFPYETCWKITFNYEDRLIEFTSTQDCIVPGGYAIVSLEFIEGPTQEDCTVGHEFKITVTERTTKFHVFYLKEYIDKTPPQVQITFPDASTPGGSGYAFIKKKDGYIWVLMPNCTDKRIGWLWINGTASDTCSGINRVEIWINGTYMGDATLSGPVGSKNVKWWWYTDPTKNPAFWKTQAWYNVTARAYDNSVNNELYAKGRGKIPRTNNAETTKWFFWIGTEGPVVTVCIDRKPIDWAPGNGRIDVWGQTGFYPNDYVEIWLENEIYGVKKLLKTEKTDNYGRFYTIINHLPEVPRKPTCEDHWIIRAYSPKGNLEGSDRFAIIPWITYEDTFSQDDPRTWRTTKAGYVGDTIMVYGHGFLPSRQSRWDPYSTVYVRIVYTDVAPLEKWDYRRVFNGTSQLDWTNLEWYPRLSEKVLAEVTTDANGYWKAQIKIPQSYGGLHAIYAYEYKIVTDLGMPGPKTPYVLVKSGWPQCTGVDKEEQAVIFDVWPTIQISPSGALVGQYVTITGEGLPLPRHYRLLKNGKPIVDKRDWCLVLDFGPFTQWVFENKRIRNNEFDQSWAFGLWYPFAYYSPDPATLLQPESLVWHGKLCSVLFDYETEEPQVHFGSKFLKVPILTNLNYTVRLYYFDKNAGEFTNDHGAETTIRVLKDPLNINLEVGATHFPGEKITILAKIDVDGILEDATTINVKLYKGSTFVAELPTTRITTGLYSATYTLPGDATGDYFVVATASKTYDTITLQSSTATSFAVSPSLATLLGTLKEIKDDVAIVKTDVGDIKVDLNITKPKVISIEGSVATLNTAIGLLKANVSAINAKVIGLNGELDNIKVTIDTKFGTITQDLSVIKEKVTVTGDLATISTTLGDIQGKVNKLSSDGKITLATINTEIGTIKTKVDSIEGNTGLQPASVGLSLIAALAAIAAAVLILRKVYTK
ncbi:MAG: PKD domain-containing protein [Candidatus Bathyarchaeia archaeon]